MNLGGFGGVNSYDIIKIPSAPLKIGDRSFEMGDIAVFTSIDAGLGHEYGNFGMDLITLFSEVIINLHDLFIEAK